MERGGERGEGRRETRGSAAGKMGVCSCREEGVGEGAGECKQQHTYATSWGETMLVERPQRCVPVYVCSRMLTEDEECNSMLTHADVCSQVMKATEMVACLLPWRWRWHGGGGGGRGGGGGGREEEVSRGQSGGGSGWWWGGRGAKGGTGGGRSRSGDEGGGVGYLVFRGTDDTNDIFTDVTHSQVRLVGGVV